VDYQRLLLDHLDLISQIVRTTGRRQHLSATEREDFAGFVNLRLIEDHYAILRKYKKKASFRTYLITVIQHLSHDFCAEEWGRWRPTAMATRLGPVAILLERLVIRDLHTIEEAIEIVRTHHDVDLTDAELWEIWRQLPRRARITKVAITAAADVSSDDNTESAVEDEELRRSIEQLRRIFQTALAELAAQDRILIGLRFDQRMSIAEISQLTGRSVPNLHHRLAKSLRQLGSALTQSGLSRTEILRLIGHPSIALPPLLRTEVERFLNHVRLFKRDG
jgi:RNA polymerase sigma factor for flagellar operon FliA